MAEPDMTLVQMQHPKLDHDNGELPTTTRQAFEDVWKAKGWQLVKADASAPAAGDEVPAPGEPEPSKSRKG